MSGGEGESGVIEGGMLDGMAACMPGSVEHSHLARIRSPFILSSAGCPAASMAALNKGMSVTRASSATVCQWGAEHGQGTSCQPDDGMLSHRGVQAMWMGGFHSTL